jgi:hypothetical protein
VNPYYPDVARRAGHRCEYCRAPEVGFNFPFEVEHVIPTARGGADDPANLALSCRACNLRKRDVVSGPDATTGEEVRLFDPRSDRWSEHFGFDPDTAELIPLTPVGRVTAAQLDLNHPFQLAARQLWMQLRLYP